MGDETSGFGQLTYAVPLGPGEERLYRGAEGVRFELGPVPTEIFITRVVAETLFFTFVAGAWLLVSPVESVWMRWAVAGGYALTLALVAVRLTRHRLTPRVVGGTPDNLFYSGPDTRGAVMAIPREDVQSIEVCRSYWRPWVFELIADRKSSDFWSRRPRPYGPVVLLVDLDHAVLTRIAAELGNGGARGE